MEEFNLRNSKLIKNFTDEELNEIGRVMGDNNFYAYFNISSPGNRAIFIEDERIETINAFKRNGFLISKGLKGITEIAKYLAVTTSNPEFIKTFTYFIIDNDNGSSYIKSYLDKSNLIKEKDGFKKFRLNAVPNVFIILLPEDLAAEGLFSEYSTHLDACVKKLWDSENNDWNKSIDRGLVRTCGEIKSQKILPPDCEGQIRKLIKNKQEVKDMFWKEVELKEWKFDKEHIKVLNEFLK